MMYYGPKPGNRFILTKDEVTNLLYIQYVQPFGIFLWLIEVRMIRRVEVAQKSFPLG